MQTIMYSLDKQQDSTVQHKEYIQCSVINHHGKEHEKNVYMCIIESLCYTAEINTVL